MSVPVSRFCHICTKFFVYLLFPNGWDNWHIVFMMTYLAKAYSREDKMFGGREYSLGIFFLSHNNLTMLISKKELQVSCSWRFICHDTLLVNKTHWISSDFRVHWIVAMNRSDHLSNSIYCYSGAFSLKSLKLNQINSLTAYNDLYHLHFIF